MIGYIFSNNKEVSLRRKGGTESAFIDQMNDWHFLSSLLLSSHPPSLLPKRGWLNSEINKTFLYCLHLRRRTRRNLRCA